MKCGKCGQTGLSLTKAGLIPKHRIPRGWPNQKMSLPDCPWSGRKGRVPQRETEEARPPQG